MNVGSRTRKGWLIRIISDFLLLRSRVEMMAKRNEGRKVMVAPSKTGN